MLNSQQLLSSLQEQRLLNENQVTQISSSISGSEQSQETLCDALRAHGGLTDYQLEQALSGQISTLVLNNTYALLERIGEGGMGQVFKAKHLVLKSVRAVKVIRPECTTSKVAVDRFYREMESVARLNHPNIVQAYDAGQTPEGTHYFVMEYVEGEDLSKMLREGGAFSIGEAANYVRQAALGLQHAHENGMIHRDIKPSNLLLTTQGVIKVLDLGLARLRDHEVEDQLTPTGVVMGTPDYMAPEQTIDAKHVTIRADIYALGCTLYHLLVGQVPFPGGDTINKLIRHRQKKAKPVTQFRNDVPEAMLDILARMIAKHPKNRPATPQEVADALEPFLGMGGAPSGRTVPASVSTEPNRRKRQSASGSRIRKSVDPRTTPVLVEPIPEEEDADSFPPLKKRSSKPLIFAIIAVVLLAGVGLGVAFWPGSEPEDEDDYVKGPDGLTAVQRVRLAAQRTETSNDLKQIGLAMHSYYDTYRSLPPALFRFPRGKPGVPPNRRLSWRVELLPYLEHNNLYKQFRLDEPWDSEHNKKLIPMMPKVFRHPGMPNAQQGMTHYQIVKGPGTIFEKDRSLRLEVIPDGTSNTILVVDAKKPVVWTAPDDVDFPEKGDPKPLLNDPFPGGFLVLMADGSTRTIQKAVSAQTLRNAMLAHDGQVLGSDW